MKRKPAYSLFLIVVACLSSAQSYAKKHPSLPEIFSTAQTVFVETRDGGDITDIKLDPDDRTAILDVQDGVQDWGRYTLSRSRHDADLILVVHKGRVWRDQPGPGSPGVRTPAGQTTGHVPLQNPADASQGPNSSNDSPDGYVHEKDELRVYTIQPNGKLKGPIWEGELERGLNGPDVLLLQRLKGEVEKAYPSTPAKKQPIT
jgi:hypothetical protein